MVEAVRKLCASLGIAEVGFSRPEADAGLPDAVTLVAKLSDAVVDGITEQPTHTYFHHYRTVNTYLDQCALRVGMLLESAGYRYVAVPASQTVDYAGKRGLFSHKQGAVLAGLGSIGKNALFMSAKYGPRVRLATVLTNCDLSAGFQEPLPPSCGNCRICVQRCPAMALSGEAFSMAEPARTLVDTAACSTHMKRAYQHIGRGAVCGICMRYCPKGMRNQQDGR